ncbi:MAG: phosphoribosylaminoimidazolesuccinocarboxamide synthase, partial [Nanoarchaeota archaeon]
MNKEQEYKERIHASLDQTLDSGFVPELGEYKKGKVRDVHFSGDKVVMVSSDRVSCFDHVLSRRIPF